jgi:hypothetical protein
LIASRSFFISSFSALSFEKAITVTADPAEYARHFEAFVGRYCNCKRAELLALVRYSW